MRPFYTLLLLSTLLLQSCKWSGSPQLMPNVSGKAGEVVVVLGRADWEGEVGVSLRSILAIDQPHLPQKEPMFNLVNIPESAFSTIFQTHRNLIIIEIDPNREESKVLFRQNIWAAPQIVVTITAKTSAEAVTLIESESDRLNGALLMAERNRNIDNAKRYEEWSLRERVTEEFGGSPYFPKGYSLKKRADDFLWISYETTYTNQAILIYRFPFKDSSDFSLTNLVFERNEALRRNVPGPVERSYMTTNKEFQPELRWIRYNRRDFAELRGLWEVENDFMGGPFVSHFFLDKSREYVIAVEAFVYAPRYNKRNYLRQVESLIYSFEYF